jgi:hypothetical protein
MTLSHVLWIGGAPGAGKTTVATRIARRHGLRWYGADTRTWVHRDRALAADNAAAHKWEAMEPAKRWTTPTPKEMLEMSLHRERGAMVVEDLRALPRSPLVVAEGTTVPAWAAGEQGIWLIPTHQFQETAFAKRELAPSVAALYRLYTEVVEREAHEHGVRVLTIDGTRDVDAVAAQVEQLFEPILRAGPRAETIAERRALLREANAAIVDQVRGYYGRPWASGDPEPVAREFFCECGETACVEVVLASVAQAASAPVVAPGHNGG